MLTSDNDTDLKQTLEKICKNTNTACIDVIPFSKDIANFILTWLETWIFLYSKNIRLQDIKENADLEFIESIAKCHLESFEYAKNGIYIYNADVNEFINIAKILSKG
uniref:Uncharacterized protein n=1 Tax=Ignisphaera aggregans TaxID=334771 RepID=A0A7C5YZT8_9CREN